MSIKKYKANADTTITDAFQFDLTNRATDSNMGASDSLEIFSIFEQADSSLERSRILIKFPLDKMVLDRQNGNLPASGSVKHFLRLYNVAHPYTLPKNFYVSVMPVSQDWQEGYGLDMESYSDPGFGLINGYGATWFYRQSGSLWSETGSAGLASYEQRQLFEIGNEDLNVDVTRIVEDWIRETIPNYGFVVKLSSSYENGDQKQSFYTKKFSARGTEYFYSQPAIESIWDSSIIDSRKDFYNKSDALSPADNTNYLYYYNKVDGRLKNIYNNPNLSVKFYANSGMTDEISAESISVSNVSSGIYKASVILNTTSSTVYDKWYSGSYVYHTNSFEVKARSGGDTFQNEEYIISLKNGKPKYLSNETVTFNLYSRFKNWSPTIYTVATTNIENNSIKNLYYRVFRIEDNKQVIDYMTGSVPATRTSIDKLGNYFTLDMSLLEPGYSYGLKFAICEDSVKEFKEVYKFRVE